MVTANAPIVTKEVPTVVERFNELLAQKKYKEAAVLAAESPQGILRTPDTVAKFQSVPVQEGLLYFGTLLTRGKLNAFESLELSRLVVNINKKNLLGNWLACKLECSEELGDLVKTIDNDLALELYIKARASPKVVAAFVEKREFDKILSYSKEVGYIPDYLLLLQTILQTDPRGAVNFALMMSEMEGGSPVDYNTITDLFLQRNLIREATAYLWDVLKPNLPEHGFLQTKVLEINLMTFPNVADAILANGMFSHYDRPRIAQLCETAGLYVRALQHYTELPDIKRVIVNTHAIELQFFGTLSREWAFECMKFLLLANLRENLQIIVQVAKEHCEQLGVDACINFFEQFRSYEGLYFFLGSYLSSRFVKNCFFLLVIPGLKLRTASRDVAAILLLRQRLELHQPAIALRSKSTEKSASQCCISRNALVQRPHQTVVDYKVVAQIIFLSSFVFIS